MLAARARAELFLKSTVDFASTADRLVTMAVQLTNFVRSPFVFADNALRWVEDIRRQALVGWGLNLTTFRNRDQLVLNMILAAAFVTILPTGKC